jgi:hypothetical protein
MSVRLTLLRQPVLPLDLQKGTLEFPRRTAIYEVCEFFDNARDLSIFYPFSNEKVANKARRPTRSHPEGMAEARSTPLV